MHYLDLTIVMRVLLRTSMILISFQRSNTFYYKLNYNTLSANEYSSKPWQRLLWNLSSSFLNNDYNPYEYFKQEKEVS